MKIIVAGCLTASLILGALCACNGNNPQNNPQATPAPTTQQAPAQTTQPAPTATTKSKAGSNVVPPPL